MPRKRADVEKALIAKGMVLDENHHHMYRKVIEGVTHVVTRISHSGKEIPDAIGKLMANQCYLQFREFWNLVDCPLGEAAWDDLIRERSIGGRNPYTGR
jgi:hypothetical protein